MTKKINILPCGEVFPIDEEGRILNPTNYNLIKEPWLALVEEIKQAYIKYEGENLHSIYLRGSVARGTAFVDFSDVDTFAVVHKKQMLEASWINYIKRELENAFSFCKLVDLQLLHLEQIFSIEEGFQDRFVIKTQSICLYGEDLSLNIEPFWATHDTAKKIAVPIQWAINRAKRSVQESSLSIYREEWCKWIMKVIIRQGFLLIMSKEKIFVRDLYPCYRLFAKHYSKQEKLMHQALQYAIEPTSDSATIIDFLDKFGNWLIKESCIIMGSSAQTSV